MALTDFAGRLPRLLFNHRGAAASIRSSLILIIAMLLAGCTDMSIAAARHRMRAGDYAAAHQYFASAVQSRQLSARERDEVMDGLCRTEYHIGAPTYSLARQLHTCAAAAARPHSESGPIYSELEARELALLGGTIKAALAQPDIAVADRAISRYCSLPDHDPAAASLWTRQLWLVVQRHAAATKFSKPAIAHLAHQFPDLKKMDRRQFRQWIEGLMTVAGTPMASDVAIGKTSVDLRIENDQLSRAAVNLDRFARVNDGLVARCHCDGRTLVSLADTGLPAYLVQLGPGSSQSEVLVLDQP